MIRISGSLVLVIMVSLAPNIAKSQNCGHTEYQYTVTCNCSGNSYNVYDCFYFFGDAQNCWTCNGCGYVCCGNFYYNACQGGSCVAAPQKASTQFTTNSKQVCSAGLTSNPFSE